MIISVSDLHMGIKNNLDFFQREKFSRFLDYLTEQKEPVDLIFNGDTFDFLSVLPWKVSDEKLAYRKVDEIITANSSIFDKLKDFMKFDKNQITMLIENHDVELALRSVQTRICDAIDDGIEFAGNDYDVDGIHFEHGNTFDSWNRVDYYTLMHNFPQFRYPVGTKLVYDSLNQLIEEYPFVGILEPMLPAVPLLLIAVAPMLVIKTVPSIVKNKIQYLYEYLSGNFALQYISDDFIACVLDALADMPKTAGQDYTKMLVARALWGLQRYKGDKPPDYANDPIATAAKGMSYSLVVCGHTHESCHVDNYYNTGCWTDMLTLPEDNYEDWVKSLVDGTFKRESHCMYFKSDHDVEDLYEWV